MKTSNPALRQKYAKQFHEWCRNNKVEASPQNMRKWDEEKNLSRWRKLFATDEDIIERGIKDVYVQIFNSYSTMVFDSPNGIRITAAVIRKAGPGVGNFADLTSPALTTEQRDYMLDKLEREHLNLTERLLLAKRTPKQILALQVKNLEILQAA